MTQFLMMLTEGANAVGEAAASPLAQLPLLSKGLVVTLVGLLSVFLVLTLYFVTIKLISRAKDKEENK